MSAEIMPSALRRHLRELIQVTLREVASGEEWQMVEVLPVHRNAHVNRYLATNAAPRLRLVTFKKFGKTWLYFQPIKET